MLVNVIFDERHELLQLRLYELVPLRHSGSKRGLGRNLKDLVVLGENYLRVGEENARRRTDKTHSR